MSTDRARAEGDSGSDRLANGCLIVLLVQWIVVVVIVGGYYLWKGGGRGLSEVRWGMLMVLTQSVFYAGRRLARWHRQRRDGERG